MPLDVSVMESRIQDELRQMDLPDADVHVAMLDENRSCVVTVISDRFEEQTFLDREMRIRPVVARVLASLGQVRLTYLVEALTPSEDTEELEHFESSQGGERDPADQADYEERRSRHLWKEQREALRKALRDSGYEMETLMEGALIVATKSMLSPESILIGFSVSPKASTVDLPTRLKMEREWGKHKYQKAYYVVPGALERPFTNQTPAAWLEIATAAQFLHALNGSERIARQLVSEWEEKSTKVEHELRGPLVNPTVRTAEGTPAGGFEDSVKRWMTGNRPSLLLLMASAGHGKTTLAEYVTYRMAQEYLDTKGAVPLPLLVPFEAVRRLVDFDSLLHKRLADLHGGAFGAFRELLRLGQAVLFVDGFDELADDAGLSVAEAQVRSMAQLLQGHAKILLAGRTIFAKQFASGEGIAGRLSAFLGKADVETLEIVPFDEDQIAEYISTREHLTPSQKEQLKAFATATPDHADLCSNPLFLRFLVILAAAGRLPQRPEIDLGVDSIVHNICAREEERQQLSIGVPRQLDFLGWVAYEIFKAAKPAVPISDIDLMAQETVADAKVESLVASKLTGHALLRRVEASGIGFIHPFFRDVLLGYNIMRDIESAPAGHFRAEPLEVRDLPGGTIRYLARRLGDWKSRLPRHWLSGVSGIRSVARRNLFRILISDVHRAADDPSHWAELDWIEFNTLSALDLSLLIVEGRNFSRMRFDRCTFEHAYLSECDLRGALVVDTNLLATTFVDCAADSTIKVENCSVSGVEVRHAGTAATADSSDELQRLLTHGKSDEDIPPDETQQKAARREAARRAYGLIRDALTLFVSVSPVGFHRRRSSEIRLNRPDGKEQLAVDRVILPQIRSMFCQSELAAGSVEFYTLEKRWRSPCVEFVRDNRLSGSLAVYTGKIAAKAARFLM